MSDLDSRHSQVLKSLLELNVNAFLDAEQAAGGSRTAFVKALIDLWPLVRKEVLNVTDGMDPQLFEYDSLRKQIAEYLNGGIVPSTLNVKQPDGTTKEAHPTAITLLNASYRFYLEGVEDLMSKIEGQEASSSQDRTLWMRRIESWTAKALEDVSLLRSSGS